jgi:hypothetical protein
MTRIRKKDSRWEQASPNEVKTGDGHPACHAGAMAIRASDCAIRASALSRKCKPCGRESVTQDIRTDGLGQYGVRTDRRGALRS